MSQTTVQLPSGLYVYADLISSAYFPMQKITLGASNADDGPVSATNPMPARVGGWTVNPSANFTRPADTTAYAVGDLVANSTTAGSVTPLSWTVTRVAASSALIRRARMILSKVDTANAYFRLHLFSASPTVANGDNGAFNPNSASSYLGAMDIVCDVACSDGTVGFGVPNVGGEVAIKLSSGSTVYGLVEARGTYTPASSGTVTVVLEVFQD